MRHNFLFLWLALAVCIVLGAQSPASAASVVGIGPDFQPDAEFLFGFSGGDGAGGIQTLTLTLSGGGTVVLSTSDSTFDAGIDNQGWWSATFVNSDTNDNYFVGDPFTGDGATELNNFFTFDISALAGTVVDATLNLVKYGTQSDFGNATLAYTLYDVSTDAATLNSNDGVSAAIFADLGSGTSYGTHNVVVDGFSTVVIDLALNAAAVADINAAIGGSGQFFSIGGSLNLGAAPGVVPEPASMALWGIGGVGMAVGAYRRRRKQAA
jgi:hypothetical protein